MTAPSGPAHWTGGVPAVVRPPSVGAATGVPFEPGEPEPPPPTSPPVGGLGWSRRRGGGDRASSARWSEASYRPVRSEAWCPPVWSAVQPRLVPFPTAASSACLSPRTRRGVFVRPAGGVLRPTAARSDDAPVRAPPRSRSNDQLHVCQGSPRCCSLDAPGSSGQREPSAPAGTDLEGVDPEHRRHPARQDHMHQT